MMWQSIKYIIVANLGALFGSIYLIAPDFAWFLMGCGYLILTATLVCEDWIESFEKWVAKLCGYRSPNDKLKTAFAIIARVNCLRGGDESNLEDGVALIKEATGYKDKE